MRSAKRSISCVVSAFFVVCGALAPASAPGQDLRQAREGLIQPGLGAEAKLILPTPPFTEAVALSADGSMALVGGDEAAYIFVRSGAGWTQQAKLTGSDAGAGSSFGGSVALAADGSRALVGANHAPATFCPFAGKTCGAAYVFVRNGSVWSEEAKLELGDDPGLLSFGGVAFGGPVSLSDDGATALVSAPFVACSVGEDCGLVAIFQRSGSAWTLEQKIRQNDPVGYDAFGIPAVLSGDGQTVLAAARSKPCTDHFDNGCGAAYVFTRSGTVWSQEAKLLNPDGGQFEFGRALALSDNGNLAAVSANASCASGTLCGAVYLFARSGGAWTFHQKLAPADVTAGDKFGWAIDLSSNGQVLLASSPGDSCSAGVNCGLLHLFVRPSGGSFTDRLAFRASDTTTPDSLGVGAALSGDATTVLAQTFPCNVANVLCGVTYAFSIAELSAVGMPTLSGAGLLFLALALAAAGALALRRRGAARSPPEKTKAPVPCGTGAFEVCFGGVGSPVEGARPAPTDAWRDPLTGSPPPANRVFDALDHLLSRRIPERRAPTRPAPWAAQAS
jgi:hypothetical protein